MANALMTRPFDDVATDRTVPLDLSWINFRHCSQAKARLLRGC